MGFKFVVDGRVIQVDTPEQINNLIQFLHSYNTLTANAVSVLDAAAKEAVPLPMHPNQSSLTNQDVVAKQNLPTISALEKADVASLVSTRRGWPQKAWESLNKRKLTPCTGDALYKEAVRLGYKSSANNPAGSFKRAIRDNSYFKKVGEDSNSATLWDMDTNRTGSEEVVPNESQRPLFPPPGQQTADYAYAALKETDSGLDSETLLKQMLLGGWTSRSDTDQKRLRALEASLYRDKTKFARLMNGRWIIKGVHQIKLEDNTRAVVPSKRFLEENNPDATINRFDFDVQEGAQADR